MGEGVTIYDENGGFLFRTPYSEEFVVALRALVPRDALHWQKGQGGKNSEHKGWWVAPEHKLAVEALVEEHFGVGGYKGALRFLGVTENAPAQIVAAAYAIRRSFPSTDDITRAKLDRAVETIERAGMSLGPPYDERGNATGDHSILGAVVSPLKVPPLSAAVLRRSVAQLDDVFRALDWVVDEAVALKNRLVSVVDLPPEGAHESNVEQVDPTLSED